MNFFVVIVLVFCSTVDQTRGLTYARTLLLATVYSPYMLLSIAIYLLEVKPENVNPLHANTVI